MNCDINRPVARIDRTRRQSFPPFPPSLSLALSLLPLSLPLPLEVGPLKSS